MNVCEMGISQKVSLVVVLCSMYSLLMVCYVTCVVPLFIVEI